MAMFNLSLRIGNDQFGHIGLETAARHAAPPDYELVGFDFGPAIDDQGLCLMVNARYAAATNHAAVACQPAADLS